MVRDILHRTLATPVRWTSHWSGIALKRAQKIRQPRILMYHIVGDEELSVQQFEWQIKFLRARFEPTRLGTLVDRLQSNTLSGREVVITFDDGVRNHYEVAWPLLRAHDVPATFFVCPDLTESGEWLWRTDLRMRLKLLDADERAAAAHRSGCRAEGVEAIMEWTKNLPMDDRIAFQRDIKQHTSGFSPSRQQMECYTPLTWDQLRQMDASLITIGSHTRTHPMLPTLDASDLDDEIAGSRRILEERLDRDVELFSYPNGANNSNVVSMVRQHYRAALTTRKGFVMDGDDLFLLPRIPAADDRASFSRRMYRPSA
jgi:peptidoglycan/xylan/chitin deacetylase (PgdA/CDA1 family)